MVGELSNLCLVVLGDFIWQADGWLPWVSMRLKTPSQSVASQ